jgi:hypothetical protein
MGAIPTFVVAMMPPLNFQTLLENKASGLSSLPGFHAWAAAFPICTSPVPSTYRSLAHPWDRR